MIPLMAFETGEFFILAASVVVGVVAAEVVVKYLFATAGTSDPPPFTSIGNSTMGAGILHVEIAASRPSGYTYIERWEKTYSRIVLHQILADGSIKDSWTMNLDRSYHLVPLRKKGMIEVNMKGFEFIDGVDRLSVIFDLVYEKKKEGVYGIDSAT